MDSSNRFNSIEERAKALIDVIQYQTDQISSTETGASQGVEQQGHTFKTNLPEKMVAKTIEIAQKEFQELKKDFSENLESKTSSEIHKFYELSSKIITLTKGLIEAKESNTSLKNSLQRLAAKVFSCIRFSKIFHKDTSAVSSLEKSLTGLKEEVEKLDSTNGILVNDCGCSEELSTAIQTLGQPVLGMIDRVKQLRTGAKDEFELKEAVGKLKSYVNRLTDSQKELNLSLRSAANYVALGDVFRNETMPHLASKEILEAKQAEIEGEFQFQVEELRKDGTHYVKQFIKDIPRGNTFKRTDSHLNIKDSTPLPSREVPFSENEDTWGLQGLFLNEEEKQLAKAGNAIGELIIEGDQDWEAPLQLAVTQSSLNQAFASAKVQLSQDGIDVVWEDFENDREYSLLTGLSDKLPAAGIEVIRNPETHQIDSVNVSVKGSLDFFKGADSFGQTEQNREVVLKDAVTASLSYTIRLNDERLPVISNFKCEIESKIPPLPAAEELEIAPTASGSKGFDSSRLIHNRRLSANFDPGPPNRAQ